MAAYRNGIKTVILPAENQKDLEEIDPTVRTALHFVPVEQVDMVLSEALSLGPVKQEQTFVPPFESAVQGQGLPSLRQ